MESLLKKDRQKDNYLKERLYVSSDIDVGGDAIEVSDDILGGRKAYNNVYRSYIIRT